jgi:hypothetical protein
MRFGVCLTVLLLISNASIGGEIRADGTATTETPAQRGFRFLTTKPYLPPDLDEQVFGELWRTWEEPLRTQAEKATADERRQMAFARYGLTRRPEDESGKPLQYVVDDRGNWYMSCLACHQGKVAGRVISGVPNSLFALETLTEDVRATKLRLKKPLGHMELGSMFMPLGGSIGTTNAVMFGVALMARRDADLNVLPPRLPPPMTHHDHDPPPWWHFKRKQYIYIDGFAPKTHRGLMQFMLVKENGPEKFCQWEDDFRDVYAWLESLEAPKYPFAIDEELAGQGREIFNQNCAECHGTYGEKSAWPGKIVSIEDVGTDRVRLDSLSARHRENYGRSWFNDYGRSGKAIAEPGGYVAPPLDGVWASAPYFHNGSAPTLWHVLHPNERPKVWRRSEDGYDQTRVGLEVEEMSEVPTTVKSAAERRHYFNTAVTGKSAAGHDFPDVLSEDEKQAVLEYLKTL